MNDNNMIIADKVACVYGEIYNNNRIDLDRLTIKTTENDYFYRDLYTMINDMLDDILKAVEEDISACINY